MATDLNISESAYSKIERGVTDPSIGRIEQIAKILGVDVTYFFREDHELSQVEEGYKNYGYATKSEIEELGATVRQLKKEITTLKRDIVALQTKTSKTKK